MIKYREYKNEDFEVLKQLYLDGRKRELSTCAVKNIIPLDRDKIKLEKFQKGIKIVADVDGEIAGFVSINSPEISLIYVDKKFVGQGIGKALLERGMNKIREIKSEEEALKLDLLSTNITAKGLYEHMGFITENEFKRVIDNVEVTITHMICN